MFRTLLFSFSLAATFSSAMAVEPLFTQIKSFNDVVKKTGVPVTGSYCAEAIESKNAKTATLKSHLNNKSIELTVMSEEEAIKIFKILKNDEENSFDSPIDACFARAHRMAIVMDEHDIVSGKAFVEGELFVDTKFGELGWEYHTASVVMVKKNGKLIPTIMDPLLFDKPVSFEEWRNLLTKKSKSKLKNEFFTKRLNYGLNERDYELSNYDEDQVEESKKMIRNNAMIGELIEYKEKQDKQDKKNKGKTK